MQINELTIEQINAALQSKADNISNQSNSSEIDTTNILDINADKIEDAAQMVVSSTIGQLTISLPEEGLYEVQITKALQYDNSTQEVNLQDDSVWSSPQEDYVLTKQTSLTFQNNWKTYPINYRYTFFDNDSAWTNNKTSITTTNTFTINVPYDLIILGDNKYLDQLETKYYFRYKRANTDDIWSAPNELFLIPVKEEINSFTYRSNILRVGVAGSPAESCDLLLDNMNDSAKINNALQQNLINEIQFVGVGVVNLNGDIYLPRDILINSQANISLNLNYCAFSTLYDLSLDSMIINTNNTFISADGSVFIDNLTINYNGTNSNGVIWIDSNIELSNSTINLYSTVGTNFIVYKTANKNANITVSHCAINVSNHLYSFLRNDLSVYILFDSNQVNLRTSSDFMIMNITSSSSVYVTNNYIQTEVTATHFWIIFNNTRNLPINTIISNNTVLLRSNHFTILHYQLLADYVQQDRSLLVVNNYFDLFAENTTENFAMFYLECIIQVSDFDTEINSNVIRLRQTGPAAIDFIWFNSRSAIVISSNSINVNASNMCLLSTSANVFSANFNSNTIIVTAINVPRFQLCYVFCDFIFTSNFVDITYSIQNSAASFIYMSDGAGLVNIMTNEFYLRRANNNCTAVVDFLYSSAITTTRSNGLNIQSNYIYIWNSYYSVNSELHFIGFNNNSFANFNFSNNIIDVNSRINTAASVIIVNTNDCFLEVSAIQWNAYYADGDNTNAVFLKCNYNKLNQSQIVGNYTCPLDQVTGGCSYMWSDGNRSQGWGTSTTAVMQTPIYNPYNDHISDTWFNNLWGFNTINSSF